MFIDVLLTSFLTLHSYLCCEMCEEFHDVNFFFFFYVRVWRLSYYNLVFSHAWVIGVGICLVCCPTSQL